MPDDYIFTNNMGAFLGSGMGIFFYEVMQRKLKVIEQWIHASDYRQIVNPLFLK